MIELFPFDLTVILLSINCHPVVYSVHYLYRPSLLNHSCWPNCTVCYNGRTLTIRMLEDVADDQEVANYEGKD